MDAYPSGSSSSPSALVWNKITPDFLFNVSAGTYLLRKDRWDDPKYYCTLTGVYDGYSGRIKFVFNEREDVPYEYLFKYAVEQSGGRGLQELNRKVVMASFKFKCGKYNSHLDSWPLSSQGGMIRLHYEHSLHALLSILTGDLLMVFDSYAIVQTEIVVTPLHQDNPGPSKRKADDDDQQDVSNDKRMRMN